MKKGIDCFLSCVNLSLVDNLITELKAQKHINNVFILSPSTDTKEYKGCKVLTVTNALSSRLV